MPVTIEMPEITSVALAGNAPGDPVTRTLPIILPPGYATAKRRYPVIVALTGFTGKGIMLLNAAAWAPNLAERLDRLYAAGMPHAIFVLPDCFTRFGGSQYINSTATGRYEDYIVEELIPWVDAHYRTVAKPEGRGVFGKSSGGYGAMILGMRHPDVFGALACHSGDMAFEICYGGDFTAACNAINRAGGVAQYWAAVEEKLATAEKIDRGDFEAVNLIAMAACYSPDASQPLGLALPLDPYTCARIPKVWKRWLQWDPLELVDRHAAGLRGMRLLYLDCGTRDEFGLHFGARRMSQALRERGIAHEHEEFDDGHMSIAYRYNVSLPKMARALASR
jgi:S-formylglutathione hydrolase FrmB